MRRMINEPMPRTAIASMVIIVDTADRVGAIDSDASRRHVGP